MLTVIDRTAGYLDQLKAQYRFVNGSDLGALFQLQHELSLELCVGTFLFFTQLYIAQLDQLLGEIETILDGKSYRRLHEPVRHLM